MVSGPPTVTPLWFWKVIPPLAVLTSVLANTLVLRSDKYAPELYAAPLNVPRLLGNKRVLPALVVTPATLSAAPDFSVITPPLSTLKSPPMLATLLDAV